MKQRHFVVPLPDYSLQVLLGVVEEKHMNYSALVSRQSSSVLKTARGYAGYLVVLDDVCAISGS